MIFPESRYVNSNPGLDLNFANHLQPEVREFPKFPEFPEFPEVFEFPHFPQFSGFSHFQISELKPFLFL